MRRLVALAILLSGPTEASQHRSSAVVREFERTHACPVAGPGTCAAKGFIVDHIRPLCAGGFDKPENMQYQLKADAAAKDKLEWAECRAVRRVH